MLTPRPFAARLPAFKDGTDTPRALLERCLETVARSEGDVHAFRELDLDGARRAADASTGRYRSGSSLGPVDGMVIGVKDIIDVAGLPTRMNSPIFESAAPALQDATCVRAARQGGAILLGKTETAEFASGVSAPTRNPHDLTRTPGGSSSGSGAAVGAGMLSAAFGTQTQGSILRPAAYCGAVGYKPTLGALPLTGVHPVSASHDHLGIIAASVADAWRLARTVSDFCPGPGHPGLAGAPDAALAATRPERLAVLRLQGFAELDTDSVTAFDGMVEHFRAAGVEVVCSTSSARLGHIARVLDGVQDASIGMMAWDMRWPYDGYAAAWPGKLGPKIGKMLETAASTRLSDYREWVALRVVAQTEVAALRAEFDAVVMPTASGPAIQGHEFSGSRTFQIAWTFVGCPTWSIPGLRVAGLPFGVQIAGFANGDLPLARHACWLEAFLARIGNSE